MNHIIPRYAPPEMRDETGEVVDQGEYAGPHWMFGVAMVPEVLPTCSGCGWVQTNHPGFTLIDHLEYFGAQVPHALREWYARWGDE